jgi:hypothetical protein
VGAAFVGFAVLVFGATSERFDPARVYFVAGASISFAFAAAAGVMHRWLADRTKSDYGQIVRTVDDDESAAGVPYVIITIVGVIATLWCAIAAFIIEGLNGRLIKAILAGGAAGLVAWSLLGLLSLVLLTFKHHRYSARTQALRERAERIERSAMGKSST